MKPSLFTGFTPRRKAAFTLIELIVVIAIIAILMALLFPAINGAMEMVRKAQARTQLVNIVNAVKHYNTEYGKYPIDTATKGTADATYPDKVEDLFDVLRNVTTRNATLVATLNPRQIVYLEVPDVKKPTAPKNGIGTDGKFYDPWGADATAGPNAGLYTVTIDGDYSNTITNPYTSNAGSASLTTGVIAFSYGRDGKTAGADKNASTSADDVISWQ